MQLLFLVIIEVDRTPDVVYREKERFLKKMLLLDVKHCFFVEEVVGDVIVPGH